jgi:non-specific serine/threonine protein kinase
VAAVHRFGSFELRPAERQLLGADGRPLALGGRAFDLLVALVERAGELVAKDDLIAAVWPGVVVEENNLQVQVSTLRKLLGAGAIATSAGRGYRFTLPLATPAAAAPPPPARRHNLPQPLTSFVGHDDDLDEYAGLFAETRLLTLTGIGGCGKTRLAIELARALVPAYDDGVGYVDLAPVQDPDRVPLTVATVLGIREEDGRAIADSIAAGLAARRLLLVLDNCEHLMAPVAALVRDLLSALPGLHVLAASREGLGVPGERAVTVRSLSFPPAGPADLAALARSESVRLFVERARLSAPRFALDVDTADAVAEICRRLDGIPLAIELAAARVKTLSVDEIRARLDDRFRLLTGGSRAAVGRQQTLLAAIRWSYDHLAPGEQALLRRLSVFAGGWTLEGAVAVATDAGDDEYAVLDRLARLVDQSLVSTRHVAGGATRYAMLETVRQYAQERLDDACEGAATRDRHLAYVVAYAERAQPELVRNDQLSWLARLDHERENVLAALAWCDHAAGGAELGLRLVFALLVYFRNRGLLALQLRVAVEALSRPGADAPTPTRARALFAAGEPAYFLGRYEEARRYAEASLAIGRACDDLGIVATGTRLLAYVTSALGDTPRALALANASVDAARALGDDAHLAQSLNALAELLRAQGRLAEAKRTYEESIHLHRQLDDGGGCAVGQVNLAVTSIALGDVGAARAWLAEGMGMVSALGSRRTAIVLVDGVTGLASATGSAELAARLHGAADVAAAAIGFQREPQDLAFLDPWVARARDALGAEAFDAAIAAGRAAAFDDAFADARRFVEGAGTAPVQIVSAALKD